MSSSHKKSNSRPKIWFRADGNVQMGLGHLVRCSALADMLKDEYIIHFVSQQIDPSIESDLLKSGFEVTRINSENEFLPMIKPTDLVVLDGYQFGTEYQKNLASLTIGLICIDDVIDKEFFADLIINQAPDASPSAYHAQPDTDFALGVDYCLLRNPFIEVAYRQYFPETSPNNDQSNTVFICFGGSDAKNLTRTTYEFVKQQNLFTKIILVTGASYEHKIELDHLVQNDINTTHYHHIDSLKMAELMSLSTLKIVPSSGILYEALATGGKVISGYYTQNQIPNYHGFLKLNAIIGADRFDKDALKKAFREISDFKPKSNIIDGKSPNRFKKTFKKLHQRVLKSAS